MFSPENFQNPELPDNLDVVDVPVSVATEESLDGFGKLVHDPNDFVTGNGFEIVTWPHTGWRPLDPHTGDEAGTTEGDFVKLAYVGYYDGGGQSGFPSIQWSFIDGPSGELEEPSFPEVGEPPFVDENEE